MKTLLLLFLSLFLSPLLPLLMCLGITACGDRIVENPAAEAPTYSEEEFLSETNSILEAKNIIKAGLHVKVRSVPVAEGEKVYAVAVTDTLDSESKLKLCRNVINEEVRRIDGFFLKYQGNFRIRFHDGDLKVLTLKDDTAANVRNLKAAWIQALQKLETQSTPAPPPP